MGPLHAQEHLRHEADAGGPEAERTNLLHGETIMILMLVLLLLFFIATGPIITIWALNLVFGLQIPLTVWTWLAVAWFNILLVRPAAGSKS
jgi:hypothetical protein